MSNFPLTFAAIDEAEPAHVLIKKGYKPITTAYKHTEWEMLENALRSLANGARRYRLAIRLEGHEIHIPRSDYKSYVPRSL